MPETYPYMVANNKISFILEQIKVAEKPKKFTNELLKQMGFASSNDRAIIPLLKRLNILNDDGAPTEYYDRLKDRQDHPFVIGERLIELYKDIYAINTEMHTQSEDTIKGAMARVTGKDEKTVTRYFATYKALVGLAKFGASPKISPPPTTEEKTKKGGGTNEKTQKPITPEEAKALSFHHNIEIHLPATTDISVYSAIFKSLRENLFE